MRILDFIVSKQMIERDPNCDFSGIVSKSRGYLYARFRFSPDWNGAVKAVVFSNRGKEEGVPLVNNMCEIPAEILTGSDIGVRVVGRRGDERIPTNKICFRQISGR